MFSFYRCHHAVVRSLTSVQEARGKRLQSFTGQLPRHSTRQRRQSNYSFVTEHIETTASVSYHNSVFCINMTINITITYLNVQNVFQINLSMHTTVLFSSVYVWLRLKAKLNRNNSEKECLVSTCNTEMFSPYVLCIFENSILVTATNCDCYVRPVHLFEGKTIVCLIVFI